ncbi:DUF6318 family protein [Gleimia sp. 6138-11-ORH1]|uniref:DUF6318 family protein n=1 Tax=Gleimia sp. 6138-11-ORH1 TaxID=2973937 RepID=UPI0021687686|nr:DUF6318 family protein [Gleimia sp. 6138-11-ORH1]MCS4485022.1 DUF6318 family protein [Gleimia sp. 6138-11-ORH1]
MSNLKILLLFVVSMILSPILVACANDTTPSEQAPQATSDNKPSETETKNKPAADENGLIPTDDPNVFKATKIVPRPPESDQYPKPEYPALGNENNLNGAKAVAVYVEDLVTYAYSTGDTTDLELVCSTRSSWCADNIEGAKKVAKGSIWYRFNKAPTVTATGYLEVPKEHNQGEYSIRIETQIWGYTYFSTTKMELAKYASKKLLRHINLSFLNGRWVIVSVDSERIE